MAISLALAFRSVALICAGQALRSCHTMVGLCASSSNETMISRRSTVPIPMVLNQSNNSLSPEIIPRFSVTLTGRFNPGISTGAAVGIDPSRYSITATSSDRPLTSVKRTRVPPH